MDKLSRFKVGETVYYVEFLDNLGSLLSCYRDLKGSTSYQSWQYEKVDDLHPKDTFKSIKRNMIGRYRVPKLHASDAERILKLICSDVTVSKSKVKKIKRSNRTGEYYCLIKKGKWMPESCLFEVNMAAVEEARYISRLLSRWAK